MRSQRLFTHILATEINLWKKILQAMRKNFAPYLSYKRDNNELLLFALRALSRDTAAYMRNRYGTEQEVIEIAEGDLLDKVRANIEISIFR